MPPSDFPFKLEFDDTRTRVGGENVSGQVVINTEAAFRAGIDSIKVVLKGVLKNLVTRQNGVSLVPTPSRHAELLCESEEIVWTSGSTSNKEKDDSNGAEVSRPFSLTLPKNCYASHSFVGQDPGQRSTLKYSIKAVGARSGFMKSALKEKLYFPVCSVHKVAYEDRVALVSDWGNRPKYNIIKNHNIHRNVVGAKLAETTINLKLPVMESYPVDYPIPYTIDAKIVWDANVEENSKGKTNVTTALPDVSAITFQLVRYHRIQAYGKLGAPHDDLCRSVIANLIDPEKVDFVKHPLETITSGPDAGKQKQEMTLSGTFTNHDIGNVTLRALKVNYTLDLTVPFQGLFNNTVYIQPIFFHKGPIDDFLKEKLDPRTPLSNVLESNGTNGHLTQDNTTGQDVSRVQTNPPVYDSSRTS